MDNVHTHDRSVAKRSNQYLLNKFEHDPMCKFVIHVLNKAVGLKPLWLANREKAESVSRRKVGRSLVSQYSPCGAKVENMEGNINVRLLGRSQFWG